ncbi:2-amino-4-hydroxy-6-hydroxymethyldihydropteridine diphosphokinase [Cellulomonas soli]|uniref:2-amino-4-hydroxy-6- hydroxymethyldihydropteridine diphosphokinase n=1 Tax=Cellulomonas soli TaxID=931535 RepID=UPI003F8436CD
MTVQDGYDGNDTFAPRAQVPPEGRPRALPAGDRAAAPRGPIVPVVHDAEGRRLDQVQLVGVSAFGYHGVFPAERREGQVFVADVVVHLDTRRAAGRDDLALTVNYGVLAEQVAAVLAGEPADLLETVAERIAATVLATALVVAVDVQLHKPQAPITVPFDDVVVAIHRDRSRLPAAEPYRAPVAAAAAPGGPERTPARGEVVPTHTAVMPISPGLGSPALASAPTPVATPDRHPLSEYLAAPVAPQMSGPTPVLPPPGPVASVQPPTGYAPGVPAPAVGPAVGPEVVSLPATGPVSGPVDAAAGHPGAELVELVEPVEVVDGELELDALDQVPAAPVPVVLAIGANLGNAQETLRQAVSDLAAVPGLHVDDVSALARTAAVGGPEQPDFLNAVVLARTTMSARDLLRATQAIEHAHGRERLQHWGPRTLDVDIVVYGSTLATTDDLELPHPRAHERAFVLQPWAQVDPDAVLPGLGGGPVAALAATAPDRDGIRWLALDWLTSPVSAPQAEPGVDA